MTPPHPRGIKIFSLPPSRSFSRFQVKIYIYIDFQLRGRTNTECFSRVVCSLRDGEILDISLLKKQHAKLRITFIEGGGRGSGDRGWGEGKG